MDRERERKRLSQRGLKVYMTRRVQSFPAHFISTGFLNPLPICRLEKYFEELKRLSELTQGRTV